MDLLFGRRARGLSAIATMPAITACGGGSNVAQDDPTQTTTMSSPASSPATTSPGGLEPRPALPPLVDGEAAACIPLCATGRINGGQLPAAKYQTRWFFNGATTIDLDTPWALWEDSTGEFSLGQLDDPDYRLVFWLDVYPVVTGTKVEGIPNTAHALLGWIQADPGLVVSDPIETTIGSVPATAVDVAISPAAVNDDPTCPAPVCHNFLGFPQWGEAFGIAGDDPYRLWFADVTYSGTDHVLVAALESRDPGHLAQFLPIAEHVMATATFPARPAD